MCFFMASISNSVVDGFHYLSHRLITSDSAHHHDFSESTNIGRRLLTVHSECDSNHGFLSFIKKVFDGDEQEDDSQWVVKMSKNYKVLVVQEYPLLFIPSFQSSQNFRYLNFWKVLFESVKSPPPKFLL